MDPQLEFFLEEAFSSVNSTSSDIGRVVIEPDYDITPDLEDQDHLSQELIRCIQRESPSAAQLASPQGWEVKTLKQYSILAKYVRRITLHKAPAELPWVEVAPPGNWI